MEVFALIWPFILMLFIYLPFLAFYIYLMVLIVKLARRGIRALDIYLDEKERRV
ncbi:hypothetical protein [Paenibacillus sp. NPDC058071]|uniref:hypothetical protein n=1 Tax=Paenibacillus sp. NPDC058071 TaxID=3346326 RepID=UPI0036DA03C4